MGWESYHPPIPKIPFCGMLFPGQIGQGPAWGPPILPCLTVRAWRPPPLPDKGFGFRAGSVSSPLSAALGSGPFLCLPSGSVSSRDPLLGLEVLCRVQACLLTPAIQGRLPTSQAWLRKLLVGGCPPGRMALVLLLVSSLGAWIPDKHRSVSW